MLVRLYQFSNWGFLKTFPNTVNWANIPSCSPNEELNVETGDILVHIGWLNCFVPIDIRPLFMATTKSENNGLNVLHEYLDVYCRISSRRFEWFGMKCVLKITGRIKIKQPRFVWVPLKEY